jgi:hypothetical protein
MTATPNALRPAGAGRPSRSRSSLRDPDAVYRDCNPCVLRQAARLEEADTDCSPNYDCVQEAAAGQLLPDDPDLQPVWHAKDVG